MSVATYEGLPLYEAQLADEIDGVMRVSLVDSPAVQSDFLAFAEAKRLQTFAVANEEKRLIRGVLMRADYPIYRVGNSGHEYYITFSAQTIRKIFEKYLREHRSSNVNLMHEPDTEVKGVDLVQIFFKDSAAGINPVGFDEIEEGSAFGEYHVTNDDVWQAVKEGTFRGFSIEGYFREVVVESKHHTHNTMKEVFRKVFVQMREVVTDKAVLLWDGDEDLKAEDLVYIEEEGERKPAPDGDYTTEDGKVIKVADGKVAEVIDPKAEVEPEADAEEDADDEAMAEETAEEAPAEDPKEEVDLLALINELTARVEALEVALADSAAVQEESKQAMETMREQVEKFAKAPAAEPAHEQFRDEPARPMLPKSAQRAADIVSAKRK